MIKRDEKSAASDVAAEASTTTSLSTTSRFSSKGPEDDPAKDTAPAQLNVRFHDVLRNFRDFEETLGTEVPKSWAQISHAFLELGPSGVQSYESIGCIPFTCVLDKVIRITMDAI